jgi:hypothetical protein
MFSLKTGSFNLETGITAPLTGALIVMLFLVSPNISTPHFCFLDNFRDSIERAATVIKPSSSLRLHRFHLRRALYLSLIFPVSFFDYRFISILTRAVCFVNEKIQPVPKNAAIITMFKCIIPFHFDL